tara:strand:- start:1640 stop:1990 length:351 start_codon:yes stop_codon:yes gene_type:complete
MKSIVIAGLLLGAAHGAHAAPYVNVEANQSYSGGDLGGTVTDIHIGTEGSSGAYSWYVQGGPSLSAPQGGDSSTEFSAKAGGAVDVGPASVYGEVSGSTTESDPVIGLKAGVKYSF